MESDAVVIGGTLITAAADDKKAKSAGFGQQYRRDQRPAACLAVLREKRAGMHAGPPRESRPWHTGDASAVVLAETTESQ